MKKDQILIICNAVLGFAVIILFILHFAAKPKAAPADEKPAQQQPKEVEINGEHLPIAFVNTDSILLHYTLAVEANDRLMSQYEEAVLQLDAKAKSLQKEYETFQQDYVNFQKKVETGAFLSRERAESEAAKLEKKQEQLMAKQQEMENMRQQKSTEFMNNQAALTQQLQDSVQQFLSEYNADGHYHLILNSAVVMNKVAGYEITNDVIEGLNARYKK